MNVASFFLKIRGICALDCIFPLEVLAGDQISHMFGIFLSFSKQLFAVYLRAHYNKLIEVKISQSQVFENILFTGQKIHQFLDLSAVLYVQMQYMFRGKIMASENVLGVNCQIRDQSQYIFYVHLFSQRFSQQVLFIAEFQKVVASSLRVSEGHVFFC